MPYRSTGVERTIHVSLSLVGHRGTEGGMRASRQETIGRFTTVVRWGSREANVYFTRITARTPLYTGVGALHLRTGAME